MHLPKLCLMAVIMAATGTSNAVCYIYSYTGYSDAYQVVRGGKTISVAPFLPLLDGDRVIVVRPRDKSGTVSTLTVSLNGQLQAVDGAHSPYCVGKTNGDCHGADASYTASATGNPALAVFKNILASIAPLFGAAQDDAYSSQVDQMVTRGLGGPKVPMLPASPVPIEPANSTVVAFAWLGGTQPFTVTVTPASGSQPLVTKTGVTANNIVLSGLQLAPGTYQVQIQDAQQQKATGTFQCVNASAPTTPIDSISGDIAIPPATIATIRAGLLAHRGQQYYLLAYQALAALPDDPPNGQVHNLRSWLAEGLPPTNLGQ